MHLTPARPKVPPPSQLASQPFHHFILEPVPDPFNAARLRTPSSNWAAPGSRPRTPQSATGARWEARSSQAAPRGGVPQPPRSPWGARTRRRCVPRSAVRRRFRRRWMMRRRLARYVRARPRGAGRRWTAGHLRYKLKVSDLTQ